MPLRIDPTGNWSLETSLRMAELLGDDLQITSTRPRPGRHGRAAKRTDLPLVTNMVVTDFDEFRRSVALNSVQIVLADHHYWGGCHTPGAGRRQCQTFGLGVSMHPNSHSGISLMAMAHVAASVPNLDYAGAPITRGK